MPEILREPEKAFEEVVDEKTDRRIETKSAVWDQRINLELTETILRKKEKKVVESGEERKKIEIGEESGITVVSYPSPGKTYRQEAGKAVADVETVREPDGDRDTLDRHEDLRHAGVYHWWPVFVTPTFKVDIPGERVLEPSTHFVVGETTSEVLGDTEGFSFDVVTVQVYGTEGTGGEVWERRWSRLDPGSDRQYPSTPETSEDYELVEPLSQPVETELYLETFDDSGLEYDFIGDLGVVEAPGPAQTVFRVDYGGGASTSRGLVVDLRSMFPHRESVSGSEAVETLWTDYGVEATVAEIPYFSENSGKSWDEGWNSFDMVLQMDGMNMVETEYLSGDLRELESLEQPAARSIGSEFSTDQAIEFRESEEFGGCNSDYTASGKTQEAWAERYGEEVLELEGIERGVYAAFEEETEFRGAPMDPEDAGFLTDSAVEMLQVN